METLISGSGISLKPRAMAFTCGKMEIGTKANGKTVSNMDRAQTFLQMETFIPDSISLESLTALVNTSGKMEVTT